MDTPKKHGNDFFLRKVILGIWNFCIAMTSGSERAISRVSGNDKDYKVTAEADKNKNVSLENVSC